jgi:hypothetical protein
VRRLDGSGGDDTHKMDGSPDGSGGVVMIRADAWVWLMMRLVLRRNFDISVIFKCNQKHGGFIITGQPQHSQRRTRLLHIKREQEGRLSGLGSREYVALDRVSVRANALHTDTKKDKGKDQRPESHRGKQPK